MDPEKEETRGRPLVEHPKSEYKPEEDERRTEIVSVRGDEVLAAPIRDEKGRWKKGYSWVDVQHKKSFLHLLFLKEFKAKDFKKIAEALKQKLFEGDLQALELFARIAFVPPAAPTIVPTIHNEFNEASPTDPDDIKAKIEERIKEAKALLEKEKELEDTIDGEIIGDVKNDK